MKPKALIIAVAVAGAVLALGAGPAATADNGTIVGTVSVQAAAAPCIQISTTAIDFGTLPFASSGASSFRYTGDHSVTNCSTAVSNIFVAGTNAAGPGGAAWALTQGWSTCNGNVDKYGIFGAEMPESYSGPQLSTTPQNVWHVPGSGSQTPTWQPADSETFRWGLYMPCVGSSGAGQTMTFTIGFTATVA